MWWRMVLSMAWCICVWIQIHDHAAGAQSGSNCGCHWQRSDSTASRLKIRNNGRGWHSRRDEKAEAKQRLPDAHLQ